MPRPRQPSLTDCDSLFQGSGFRPPPPGSLARYTPWHTPTEPRPVRFLLLLHKQYGSTSHVISYLLMCQLVAPTDSAHLEGRVCFVSFSSLSLRPSSEPTIEQASNMHIYAAQEKGRRRNFKSNSSTRQLLQNSREITANISLKHFPCAREKSETWGDKRAHSGRAGQEAGSLAP